MVLCKGTAPAIFFRNDEEAKTCYPGDGTYNAVNIGFKQFIVAKREGEAFGNFNSLFKQNCIRYDISIVIITHYICFKLF